MNRTNPLAKIAMLTLLADAPMWADVAEDTAFRKAVHAAMLAVDQASAPRYAYLKAPESIWADLDREVRQEALFRLAESLLAEIEAEREAQGALP